MRRGRAVLEVSTGQSAADLNAPWCAVHLFIGGEELLAPVDAAAPRPLVTSKRLDKARCVSYLTGPYGSKARTFGNVACRRAHKTLAVVDPRVRSFRLTAKSMLLSRPSRPDFSTEYVRKFAVRLFCELGADLRCRFGSQSGGGGLLLCRFSRLR